MAPWPRASLVTGYDFLADAATAVRRNWLGTGGVPTPSSRRAAYRHRIHSRGRRRSGGQIAQPAARVIFLAGHFSANSALAADFSTNLLTTDLAASSIDLTNAIVFSAGCHSEYNIVDADAIAGVTMPLDWAQAFARKQALIAGTGYQYGDTDFSSTASASTWLCADCARQVPSRSAKPLVRQARLPRDHADIRGIHERRCWSTLFGLCWA
jgi:hypothetical protein